MKRKQFSGMILVMAVCFLFAMGVKGEAETAPLSKNNFRIVCWEDTTGFLEVKVKMPSNASKMEIQLQNADKKTLNLFKAEHGSQTYIFKYPALTENKIYYYRARVRYDSGNWGKWSYRRAISTCTPSVDYTDQAVKVKTPKTKGVKKFELWMSTAGCKKGFKKIGYLNPGAMKKIPTDYRKNQNNTGLCKNYYFFLKPYLKSGKTDGSYNITGVTAYY